MVAWRGVAVVVEMVVAVWWRVAECGVLALGTPDLEAQVAAAAAALSPPPHPSTPGCREGNDYGATTPHSKTPTVFLIVYCDPSSFTTPLLYI